MTPDFYLLRLTGEDAVQLQSLEDRVQLAFWGEENYRRFLDELPEYFGCKAMAHPGNETEALVGFFLARALYESLELLKLGVFPSWQRMGVGTQLMEHALTEGIRRGCNRCFLEVRKSNQKAIQFYYRNDFRIIGTRVHYYTNPVEDAWVMDKAL
ncbi:MAG: ribosomal protein S18-alanine N-acetyltransferase [Acidobacteriota bacterium]|jgi:ribosomal-protein-alanine N-acetyltransferase